MKKLLVLFLSLSFGSYAQAQSASSQSGLAKATAAASIGLNAWMGKKMMAKCTASSGSDAMSCVIAGMAFLQIPNQVQTLISSGKTESQVRTNTGGVPDFTGSNTGYDDSAPFTQNELDTFVSDANQGLNDLEKNGFKTNRSTGAITGPNGSTASGSDFNSGEALAETGLIGDDQIDAYNNTLKDIKKKKDKIIVKSLGGTKGGYSGKRKRRSASLDFDSYSGYGSGLDPSKIKAAQTSGLTKDFGGTPIGVASDDLFNMVSERYGKIADKRQFIDNAKGTYPGQP